MQRLLKAPTAQTQTFIRLYLVTFAHTTKKEMSQINKEILKSLVLSLGSQGFEFETSEYFSECSSKGYKDSPGLLNGIVKVSCL